MKFLSSLVVLDVYSEDPLLIILLFFADLFLLVIIIINGSKNTYSNHYYIKMKDGSIHKFLGNENDTHFFNSEKTLFIIKSEVSYYEIHKLEGHSTHKGNFLERAENEKNYNRSQ